MLAEPVRARRLTDEESADPDRDAKLNRIEYVTSHYPDRSFAFDQFGPLSIWPVHGSAWAERKRPVRLPASCHRTHGVRYSHCCSVGGDQLWARVDVPAGRRDRGADRRQVHW